MLSWHITSLRACSSSASGRSLRQRAITSRQHEPSSSSFSILFQYHITIIIFISSKYTNSRYYRETGTQYYYTSLVFSCCSRWFSCQLAIYIYRPSSTSIYVFCISRPKCKTRWAISTAVYIVFSWKVCTCVYIHGVGSAYLLFLFLCPIVLLETISGLISVLTFLVYHYIRSDTVLAESYSDPFTVYPAKLFPGMRGKR